MSSPSQSSTVAVRLNVIVIVPPAAYGQRHDLVVNCSPSPSPSAPKLGELLAGSVKVPAGTSLDVPSFTTDKQSWEVPPAGVGLPKSLAIVARRRPGIGAPHLVALVGPKGRVMAYGPSELHFDIVFGEHDAHWQAWGFWRALDADAPALKLDRVVRFGADGVVSYGPKPTPDQQ